MATMRRYGTTPERRRDLREHQTDAEAKLWYFLKGRHLAGFKFRRQHSIGPYILDFYCPERRAAVELDGSQHLDRVDYDDKRTAFLEPEGIRVLRFGNHEVLTTPWVCWRRFGVPSPSLSHCGERGTSFISRLAHLKKTMVRAPR